MSLPEPTLDIHEALERIPALTLLSDEVRKLVEASFEAVAYSLGDEIVREGDPADAFYVLVDGSASVVKRSVTGGEVALNVLHGGDTFGEMALLEDTTRAATVRASGRVEALRLDRQRLLGSDPVLSGGADGVRGAREPARALELPAPPVRLREAAERGARAPLRRSSSAVEVSAGDVVVRRGRPARADVRDRERPRTVVRRDGARKTSATSAPATSSASAPLLARRAARRDRRGGHGLRAPSLRPGRCSSGCSASTPSSASGWSSASRSTTTTGSRASRSTSPRRSSRPRPPPSRRADRAQPSEDAGTRPLADALELEGDGRRRADAASAGSRTSTSSTRWTAARRLWRWSAATSGARSASRGSARPSTHRPTERASPESPRGAEELGLDARVGARLEEPARRAAAPGDRPLGGQPLGRPLRRRRTTTSASPIPRRGLRQIPRDEFLEKWSGYASLVAYDERFERHAGVGAEPRLARSRSSARISGRSRSPSRWPASPPGCSSSLPILTQVVVDQVLPDEDVDLLWLVLGGDRRRAARDDRRRSLVQRYLLAPRRGPLRRLDARLRHREAARAPDDATSRRGGRATSSAGSRACGRCASSWSRAASRR